MEFTTDCFKNTSNSLGQKTLYVELVESKGCNKGGVTKVVGRTEFKLRDALTKAKAPNGKIKLFLWSVDKKSNKGILEVSNFMARRFYTFFDQIFRNKLNIVPVVGVDFSLSNLTMDDNSFCLHSLKPGAPNEYVSAFRAVH